MALFDDKEITMDALFGSPVKGAAKDKADNEEDKFDAVDDIDGADGVDDVGDVGDVDDVGDADTNNATTAPADDNMSDEVGESVQEIEGDEAQLNAPASFTPERGIKDENKAAQRSVDEDKDEEEIDLFKAFTIRDKHWWNKYKIAIGCLGGVAGIVAIVLLILFCQWQFTGVYTDDLGDKIVGQVTMTASEDNADEKTPAVTTTTRYIMHGFDGEPIEIEMPEDMLTPKEYYKPITVDFDELTAMYPNAIGWVEIPQIGIKYPVAQYSDNDYYLTHSIDGTISRAGWVFADYRLRFNSMPRNTIIYGHNMKDGTIFGKLQYTLYEDWWSNPENQYIYFTTKDYTCVYQVYNVMRVDSKEVNYARRDLSNDNIKDYFDEMLTYNLLNEGQLKYFVKDYESRLFKSDSKIITLSTCADAAGAKKFVVQGILVYEERLTTGVD